MGLTTPAVILHDSPAVGLSSITHLSTYTTSKTHHVSYRLQVRIPLVETVRVAQAYIWGDRQRKRMEIRRQLGPSRLVEGVQIGGGAGVGVGYRAAFLFYGVNAPCVQSPCLLFFKGSMFLASPFSSSPTGRGFLYSTASAFA